MDFFQARERSTKRGNVEIYPTFFIGTITDLMVRGRAFYAIWDEEVGLWSTKEKDVQRLVDKELYEKEKAVRSTFDGVISVKSMSDFSSKSWLEFKTYVSKAPDEYVALDGSLTFSNTKVKKSDYASKRLPYPLEHGSYSSYDEIIGTLYDPEERAKLEWAIGAVVSGDSRDIQKFVVLYGEAGAGKSTILNIIQKLFDGYYTTFEAKELASSNNQFSTEVFRSNPLVGIQHDGDLSKIEDNSKLNSIVSHEEMTMNEKYKSKYTDKLNCFLFMATNKPVKITDAKSGIIRRLIDVKPSGRKIPSRRYHDLMAKIDFELGAIAYHCLEVYQKMGKNYYSFYRPLGMMFKTDPFFNFVEANYDEFKSEDGISLSRAYDVYKAYCEDGLVEFKLPRYKFREEFKNYFSEFYEVTRIDGKQVRSYYQGFLSKLFEQTTMDKNGDEDVRSEEDWLVLDKTVSLLDEVLKDCPAQYASSKDKPVQAWDSVTTTLKDLDTTRVHYLKGPGDHVMVDFDLKDETGKKSAKLNLEAARKWPKTYAEYSKGGEGIHLHYIYDGDVGKLRSVFSEGIEIKAPIGGSSMRRRLSKCNDIPIATINSGLPLKEEKVVDFEGVKSEKALRTLIQRNLRKEIHPGTKPSMDFVKKILDDAYASGLKYDVSDMRSRIFEFASNSSNQADYCMRMVGQLKFKSEDPVISEGNYNRDELVFFDVEVFPNLFIVNWKFAGPESKCVHMVNPSSKEIEDLMRFKLVGFNCRKYDNHILYARYLGYDNTRIYQLSKRLIGKVPNSFFGKAYNISYTDIYDFASAGNKKSLKKFEIELGIHHQELGLPWDNPVPEEMWPSVAEYCDNDVMATEATFNHLKGDWTARQILSELSGLTVNDTTNDHSKKIMFGDNKTPQTQFNYRNLAEPVLDYDRASLDFLERHKVFPGMFERPEGKSLLPFFPGYTFANGVSIYRGEKVGEGGWVYAEPGMHYNVAVIDLASGHPRSVIAEVLFGPVYTEIFRDIVECRVNIKRKNWEVVNSILDGKLQKYVKWIEDGIISGKDLSNALKTAINSVYGLTAAGFENQFRDPRNIDNIVAKREALFMIDLKFAVQEKGFTVAHIKTDSIKIPDATPEIIQFVMDFGKKYGYEFEHETTYERMCLVNDAVYIARYRPDDKDHPHEWTATGAQFAHPYVFKTLFSKKQIGFEDMCETKSVTSAFYLDMNERLPDVSEYEKELKKLQKKMADLEKSTKTFSEFPEWSACLSREKDLEELISTGHDYKFVGKSGLFVPLLPGSGGGRLMREGDGKYYAVSGTTGYRWLEAEVVTLLGKEAEVDSRYHVSLVDKAIENISKYGDFEIFVSDNPVDPPKPKDVPPWALPCGEDKYALCVDCPKFHWEGLKEPSCELGIDLKEHEDKVFPF